VQQEFKDFISKGNLVDLAVAVVLGAAFGLLIEAFIKGVIGGIIAAIFGKPSVGDIGFDIGKGRIDVGLVINALINFLVIAFVLFLVVKAYNKMKKNQPPAPPTTSEALLAEIRDSLKAGR
jgi:large conductance mechanosensitive channel